MEITIIHGQAHKGSTYHITEMVKEKLADPASAVNEYFMIKDTPGFCVGCYNCINKGEHYCPHAQKVQEIAASMIRSDIIIIDSPVYCLEMTGQLKTLLDHFGYMWLSHRPRKEMFNKIGIVITTAAGGGSKSTAKSIANQMFWWGIPKIFKISFNVSAMCWNEVSEKIKSEINAKTDEVSGKIKNSLNKVLCPDIRIKFLFNIMKKMQISNNWNKTDRDYWKNIGWLDGALPWRL